MVNRAIHEYATEGETVCFEVQEEVFICSPEPFMASNFFATLLCNCQSSIFKPISLPRVTIEEFSLFAPFLHKPETAADDPGFKPQQWETIRRLATLWGFESVRQMALVKVKASLAREPSLSAGPVPKSQNPFLEIHEKLGAGVQEMAEEPVGGIGNILGEAGKGLATGVGAIVLLPFAVASLPFIGIHKGIKWASSKKAEE
ncbi:hypothetical protein FRB96_009363 [Tulasnella sp. 330]|nr:hypothetical protein FRB96_009363 [Tulasnella sp. 330]KAG8882367.1 hypothetical protein FRB98_003747 [Tulasnella sp. 332]KAG8885274.1 hypothetical protein FRB97_001720 [Tulasnella sp. 331]